MAMVCNAKSEVNLILDRKSEIIISNVHKEYLFTLNQTDQVHRE
jgi:hypothetical protein